MRELRYLFLILLSGMIPCLNAVSQELKCNVTVIAPQVSNVDPGVFQNMEGLIQDFMNDRKWTSDNFEFEERIECNLQLTVSEAVNQTEFAGSIQIQSSRPVYNSDYKTPLLSINDADVQFVFLENSLFQFSIDQHRNNLTSILAYYAYIILGYDYDSFSEEGGSEHFLKAQTIVANAQNSGEPGWKASEGQQNRYWLVENHITQTFKPLRNCLYQYHRHGFDKLYENAEAGRESIANALIGLRNTHKIRPGSYNFQAFFFAKSDEIVNLFKSAPQEERLRVYNVLKQVDPSNISKYERMMN
jgi:hypothetical protein